MLFGWPALAVIILLSLLASPLLLPDKRPPLTGPPVVAADVKYTANNAKKPIISEEIPEIRALYAPDLFASRGNYLPDSQAAANRSDPKDIISSENPLFLSFPHASNETGGQLFATAGKKIDNYETGPGFRLHSSGRPSHRTRKPVGDLAAADSPPRRTGRLPRLSIELKGELKRFSVDPDIFQDIALPAEQKPWSVQAEVRINNEGRVEHVFAEPMDCEPSIYREIVKRLYKCRYNNATQACEGAIIISCP